MSTITRVRPPSGAGSCAPGGSRRVAAEEAIA